MLALLLHFALGQEPAAPAAPASDPAAVELFRAAAAAQFLGAEAKPVEGFQVQLTLLERGETRREVDLGIRYRHEGGAIRMSVADSERGGTVQKGYDGRRYWLRDGEQPLLELSGREFGRDREAIDDARALCDEMLLLMDLRRLEPNAQELRVEAGSDGSQLLHGRWPRGGETWSFTLQLAADLTPLELRLTPPAAPDAPARPAQRFLLRHYAEFERRRVPQLIEEYHDPGEYPVRILEVRKLHWRTPPSAAEMAAP